MNVDSGQGWSENVENDGGVREPRSRLQLQLNKHPQRGTNQSARISRDGVVCDFQ